MGGGCAGAVAARVPWGRQGTDVGHGRLAKISRFIYKIGCFGNLVPAFPLPLATRHTMDPNSVCEVFNCNMCHNVCARERERKRETTTTVETQRKETRGRRQARRDRCLVRALGYLLHHTPTEMHTGRPGRDAERVLVRGPHSGRVQLLAHLLRVVPRCPLLQCRSRPLVAPTEASPLLSGVPALDNTKRACSEGGRCKPRITRARRERRPSARSAAVLRVGGVVTKCNSL